MTVNILPAKCNGITLPFINTTGMNHLKTNEVFSGEHLKILNQIQWWAVTKSFIFVQF
jgi:hypothetical protein